VVGVIFYFLSNAQSNLVNWILFMLSVFLCAFLVKGDGKDSTLRHSKNLAWTLKIYSFLILNAEILFITFIGVTRKEQEENFFA
jgi:hypothetical protein